MYKWLANGYTNRMMSHLHLRVMSVTVAQTSTGWPANTDEL